MSAARPDVAQRVDWFRVLSDLKVAGLSLRNIAALAGMSKAQLVGLRNKESDPKYQGGETLLRMWKQATGLGEEDLPRWSGEFRPVKPKHIKAWEAGRICCPLCGTLQRSVQEANAARAKRSKTLSKPSARQQVDERQAPLLF